MNLIHLPIQLLTPQAQLPQYASNGAAALDLCAALEQPLTLQPGGRALVSTGVAVALPEGCAGLLFARSGLAVKHGLALSNGVGVIDSDYRGEIRVGLHHQGDTAYTIQPGERIAQLGVFRFETLVPTPVEALPETTRGAGGFGSTGRLAGEEGAHGQK